MLFFWNKDILLKKQQLMIENLKIKILRIK